MLVKFNMKDSQIPKKTLEQMEKKLQARFHRYFADEPETKTTVLIKITDQKHGFKAELTLSYQGYLLRAETSDDQASTAALDKAIDILERQLVKCKNKLAQVRHQPVLDIPDIPVIEEEPDEYPVVRIKHHEIKPMTVQEAILNMNMLGHSFYMFRNGDSGKVATVYRRDDGAYGLIEEE